MSQTFEEALDALDDAVESGSGARVLDALLTTWRVRRLASLAEAIDALSERYDAILPPITAKTERARYERLLDLVAGKRAVDVVRIVQELPSASILRAKDHMDRIAVMEPDPRIATALYEHVVEERFNVYHKIWTAIFRELRRHGDVRTRARLEAIPVTHDAHVGFVSRIRTAIEALPADLPASEEEARRIGLARGAIERLKLDEPSAPAKATGRDEAALLADVAAHPEDDATRLVLADLWLERGDVRGELVRLQIENLRSEKPLVKNLTREKQLVKKHLLELLGPLEPIVDRKTAQFSRGFLSHADVKLKTKEQRALVGHPLLSTIESLGTRELALIRHPSMKALRTVRGLPWKVFVELAQGAPLPDLRRIEIECVASDPANRSVDSLAGLPNVTEIVADVSALGGNYTSDPWSWLLYEAHGELGLRGFELRTSYRIGGVAVVLAELDRHPRIPRFRLGIQSSKSPHPDLLVEIERSAQGYRLTLSADVFWHSIVAIAFDQFARRDVILEVHPPRKATNDFDQSLSFLRQQVGDRLIRL